MKLANSGQTLESTGSNLQLIWFATPLAPVIKVKVGRDRAVCEFDSRRSQAIFQFASINPYKKKLKTYFLQLNYEVDHVN